MAEETQNPERSNWYLTPEEANRVASGHRKMMELPLTTPIGPAIASGTAKPDETKQPSEQ